ncbi:MAG TPA: cation:dicarboxylase symporter family transporter, partial [Stellaceae bacterium]|nr:cation:dicarboxylase symporter family transporter [Stellaceae bacterium]
MTVDAASVQSRPAQGLRRLIAQLWFQVAVATVAGILLGVARPDLGAAAKPLGDLFIQLVRLLVPPVIFCTVVHGVGGMNDLGRTGRVAVKALLYFAAVTLAALVLALAAVNLWRPGEGMH